MCGRFVPSGARIGPDLTISPKRAIIGSVEKVSTNTLYPTLSITWSTTHYNPQF